MFNTKQKSLILSIINESYEHLSAQEVYASCRKVLPNISLGTVYRNLHTLVELGKIRRITGIDGLDRFDHILGEDKHDHDHFVCVKCNKIIDTEDVISIPKLIGKNEVLDYELTIKGICEVCKEEEIDYGTKR